jgi:pimeloyl-ACP methyl ester carboxylesterase/DNA-binding CsgD family transcriptional regulator
VAALRQGIRFCNAPDGVRIAYSVVGRGAPLVMFSGGHSHLELDPAGPVFGHWIAELARRHTLVRFDTRGFGLSDRRIEDHSIEAVVADLGAVIDALGLERCALLAWLGGTPFAVTYAARHPQRVTHLVLHAAYVRGWLKRDVSPRERGAIEALVRTIESGWEMDDPFVRQTITSSLIPAASAAQQLWLNEAMRVAASGFDVSRRFRTRLECDVSALAPKVGCPAIVLNALHDTNPPFEEGRLAASLIPGARLVGLESRNHVLLADEPAWGRWIEEVASFFRARPATAPALAALTARELELLTLVAEGFDNAQIAARLAISEKTVRNHITRVYAKLGVETRAQAIVLAHDAGLRMGQRSH